jgi:hypothetical protein
VAPLFFQLFTTSLLGGGRDPHVFRTRNSRSDPQWQKGVRYRSLLAAFLISPSITTARRVLALPTNDNLSPAQEDLLWKQVTHQAPPPTPTAKRARHRDDSESEDDSEQEYIPPKSRKRARTTGKTKTKAQVRPVDL